MGSFRFRRSVKILPGVRLNFNTKSTSMTFGGKGFTKTVSSTGRVTNTIGIPGTGIHYTEVEKPGRVQHKAQSISTQVLPNVTSNTGSKISNKVSVSKIPHGFKPLFKAKEKTVSMVSPIDVVQVDEKNTGGQIIDRKEANLQAFYAVSIIFITCLIVPTVIVMIGDFI